MGIVTYPEAAIQTHSPFPCGDSPCMPSSGTETAQTEPDLLRRALKAEQEVRELRAVIRDLQQQNARYRQREAEQRNILASGFTAGEKVTLLGLCAHWERDDLDVDDQGRKRTCLKTLSYQIGTSDESIGKHVEKFKTLGLVEKHTIKSRAPDGMPVSTVYTAPVEEKIRGIRALTRQEAENKWGGKRCPACNSTHLSVKRIITCLDCGNVAIDEKIFGEDEQAGSVEPDGEPKPQDAVTEKAGTSGSEPQDGIREKSNATEPRNPALLNQQWKGGPNLSVSASEQLCDDEVLERGAELVLEVAGPGREHLEMQPTGKGKYITVKRPLTKRDTLQHLQGARALGAALGHPDGRTRSLCADADNAVGFQMLRNAADKLASVGYLPLLESSPAQDHHAAGGHLWIIFDALVDARVAWAHCLQVSPELETVMERWPRKNNKVRLPGGRYVRPGVTAWCSLLSVADGKMSQNGAEAARLLLSHQTSVAAVSSLWQKLQEQLQESEVPASADQPVLPPICLDGAEVDEVWQAKYGAGDNFLVKFDCRTLIQRFNETHTLDDIHPRALGSHYAPAIWRGERDASVFYNDDGTWHDFGQHGDFPAHGDAFDLALLVTGRWGQKRQALKELGRAFHREVAAAKASSAAQAPLTGLNDREGVASVAQAEPERQMPATEVPSGAQVDEVQYKWCAALLREWAPANNWRKVMLAGKDYGGDQREWQLGVSGWYSRREVCDLAAALHLC